MKGSAFSVILVSQLMFLLLMSSLARGEIIYKSIDAEGRVSFGDDPRPGAVQVEEIRLEPVLAANVPTTDSDQLELIAATADRLKQDRIEREARRDLSQQEADSAVAYQPQTVYRPPVYYRPAPYYPRNYRHRTRSSQGRTHQRQDYPQAPFLQPTYPNYPEGFYPDRSFPGNNLSGQHRGRSRGGSANDDQLPPAAEFPSPGAGTGGRSRADNGSSRFAAANSP